MPTHPSCSHRPLFRHAGDRRALAMVAWLVLTAPGLAPASASPSEEAAGDAAEASASTARQEGARTASPPIAYPETRREVVTETLHGVEVRDPYRWLEELDKEDTRSWARAQDSLTGELLEGTPSYARHARELARWTHLRRYRAAVERAGRLFVSRTEGVGVNGLTHLVRKGDGPWRTLVDSRQLFPDGERRLSSTRSISPDGELLAFGTARTGSRWLRLHLLAVDGGRSLETLEDLHGSMASLGWVQDSSSPHGWGFYYARLEAPADGKEMEAKPEGARLFYHRLGTPQARDRLVHDPEDPRAFLVPSVTDDGRYLLLRTGRAGDPGVRILVRSSSPGASGEGGGAAGSPDSGRGEWQELAAVDDGILRFVGLAGERFFFRTDHGAPRGRLVAVRLGEENLGRPDMEEVVAADPRAVLQRASLVADRLVVLY
ncbi:MAG: hypothetical protein MI919_23855, partial [Holophagales bacterium]|nr:hypothetical protein [Holophagales bacterium]